MLRSRHVVLYSNKRCIFLEDVLPHEISSGDSVIPSSEVRTAAMLDKMMIRN
jgi:hypothetical protein